MLRILLRLQRAALFLAAASAGSSALAAQTPGPAETGGKLIDVGGHRLWLKCLGDGRTTVVFDAGAGADANGFYDLQGRLAERTRTCIYDRAGIGRSDPGPEPRTSGRMAEELFELLDRAAVPAPYLLVGHSLGAWNILLLAHRHPEQVAGVVLLDGAHPEQFDRLPREFRALVAQAVPTLRAAGRLGPAAEFAAVDSSAAEARGVRSIAPLPLRIVSAGRSFAAFPGTGVPEDSANAIWMVLQSELRQLSTESRQDISPQASHRIHLDDPELVLRGITDLLDRVDGRPGVPDGLPPPAFQALPNHSTPRVDRLLAAVESTYRAKDLEGFLALFTENVEQLDVPRRVHVVGKSSWRRQTVFINGAHESMWRRHGGRAVWGDWVVVEIEWGGLVRADALPGAQTSRRYRYSGLALLQLRGNRIARQILYGDVTSLNEQLAGVRR